MPIPAEVVPPAPPPPPREPTVVERLHGYFLEAREMRVEDDLGLKPAPPDEPPNWARTAATVQAWLKLNPDDTPRTQELYARSLIDAYLRDPYWAGAKDRETGASQPYPWNALLSEKVWRKAHEAVERDLAAPLPAVGGVH